MAPITAHAEANGSNYREANGSNYQEASGSNLIREGPSSGPLSLAPVSAKELKERAVQGVL